MTRKYGMLKSKKVLMVMNKHIKDTNHVAFLQPDGMRKLKRNFIQTYDALTFKKDEYCQLKKFREKN